MNPVRVDGSSLLGPAELWDGVALDWGGDPQLLALIHCNVTHGTGKAEWENKDCFVKSSLQRRIYIRGGQTEKSCGITSKSTDFCPKGYYKTLEFDCKSH